MPNDEDGHLEIHGSCSVVYENNLMIFGGKTDKNQVLLVKSMPARNKSLGHYAFMERLDRLSFNLEEGACNNFLDSSGGELILLCFYALIKKDQENVISTMTSTKNQNVLHQVPREIQFNYRNIKVGEFFHLIFFNIFFLF